MRKKALIKSLFFGIPVLAAFITLACFTQADLAALYDQDNDDRAIEEISAAIKAKPYDQDALFYRGILYYGKSDYDRAIEDFSAAIKIKPDDHYALCMRGLVYVFKGNYDRAIEDFSTVLKIKPDHRALYARGNAYAEKGNYDQAIEDFSAAVKTKPDDIDTLYRRVYTRYLGLYFKNVAWVDILYRRGYAYYKKGNYDKAIEDYNAAIMIKPDDQDILNSRELAYYAKANSELFSDFTDNRDGKKYKTVVIGTQTWMAENLNYYASGSKCYNNNLVNCQKYGRLYDWNTAMKVCPIGWHLPSKEEWQILTHFAGGDEVAGKKLKAKNVWDDYEGNSGKGTNDYGFFALPGGFDSSNLSFNSTTGLYRHSNCSGYFSCVGDDGNWWLSSESNSHNAYHILILPEDDGVHYAPNGIKDILFSVRCLQDLNFGDKSITTIKEE
ncbi:MAG: tetratricopeptide repeat protein [Fibromonadaceae bacterium]|nr:tetratricopeptide repeat protein [Fibromonadaceae bacterium]